MGDTRDLPFEWVDGELRASLPVGYTVAGISADAAGRWWAKIVPVGTPIEGAGPPVGTSVTFRDNERRLAYRPPT